MKKVLLIVVPIVAILILAGAGLLVYTQVIAQNNAPSQQAEKVGPIYETDEFTVNVMENTRRFIKAKFALEVSDNKTLAELEEKIPLVKDKIIMVLSIQSLEDLSTVEGKENCKLEIIDAVNEILEKGKVTKVYFTYLLFS